MPASAALGADIGPRHHGEGPQAPIGQNMLDIIVSAERIQERVRQLAAEIDRAAAGHRLHLVGVLTGAYVFMADLARALSTPVTLDFMAVTSYGTGVSSSGEVRITKDLDSGIEDRHVLLVEDIVDTGRTLTYLHDVLRTRQPASLRTACLLSKPSRRVVEVAIDYIGFEIPDRFVVGYGLDLAGQYRNLPHLAALPPRPDTAPLT